MWEVKYTVRRLDPDHIQRRSKPIAGLQVVGSGDSPLVYIRLLWEIDREGDKVGGARVPPQWFDRRKYKGDERLSKYILRFFGPGNYSLLKSKGKDRGWKSVFYGEITPMFFLRHKRDVYMETGLAPHLTTTKPVGSRRAYQK